MSCDLRASECTSNQYRFPINESQNDVVTCEVLYASGALPSVRCFSKLLLHLLMNIEHYSALQTTISSDGPACNKPIKN